MENLPNVQTQITDKPTYSAYEQLLVDYMNELNSIVNKGGIELKIRLPHGMH